MRACCCGRCGFSSVLPSPSHPPCVCPLPTSSLSTWHPLWLNEQSMRFLKLKCDDAPFELLRPQMCACEYAMSCDYILFHLQLLTSSRAETAALFSCGISVHPRLATPTGIVEPTRWPLAPGAAACGSACRATPQARRLAPFPSAWEIHHLLCCLQVLGFHPHPHRIDASSQTKTVGGIFRKTVQGSGRCFSYLHPGWMISWV